MVETLLVVVLVVVVGVSVLAYRNRSEKGIESGISSFRRELRALAPKSKTGPRPARPPVDPPRTSGVGVVRPGPEVDGGAPDDAVDGADDEDGADADDGNP